MTSEVTTISLTREEMDFLKTNNISPTRLIKNKVQEMIAFKLGKQQNPELVAKIQRLVQSLEGYSTFLNKKGLLDEFLEQEAP